MTILSIVPQTYRGYLSFDELEQYANIVIDNDDEAIDQITQAEEFIDAYVGFQKKYICDILEGKISNAPSATQFTLDANHVDSFQYINYFVGCIVELVSGNAAGQRRKVTASTEAGVLTCEAFTVTPDVGSFYRIYQVGKFPRYEDVSEYNYATPPEIYKFIPENVKRAVAAQVEYMIEMGPEYFSGDTSEKASESIGNYSYTNASGQNGLVGLSKLIAPKAKAYLRGIRCIVGEL